jgi:acetyl-CoA acyltransferase 1
MEGLAKLKPAFSKTGTSTAGNSSQVSDGASAVLLMTRALAEAYGWEILGVFRSFAAVGCDPAVMVLVCLPFVRACVRACAANAQRRLTLWSGA